MFDDIDMLEIPTSDTLTSQTESALPEPERPKTYPLLQEWLLLPTELPFQFDPDAHRRSAKHVDDFAHAQNEYITKLYKVVEDLGPKPAPADHVTPEPLGVVARDMGQNRAAVANTKRAHVAFARLLDHYGAFVDTVSQYVDASVARDYDLLQSLLEALHASSFAPEQTRPELVVRWINRYDPKPDNALVDAVMYNTPLPYTHASFWLYVTALVTRGLFAQAALSLRALKFDELEHICPVLHAQFGDLAALVASYEPMAQKGQFAAWKRAASDFRAALATADVGAEHAAAAASIRDVAGVLCGLVRTIAAHTSTWYDMYGALALFHVREGADADHAELAVAEKGVPPAEAALCDAVRHRHMRLLLAIDRLDPATAAYVSRLMEWHGCLAVDADGIHDGDLAKDLSSISVTVHGGSVSDYLLTRHAYECLEVHALAPVGVGLLASVVPLSSAHVRAVLQEFLPHYECFTNDDMEWALTLCAKFALADTALRLYLRQGEKSLRLGHVFEALSMWARCFGGPAKESAAAMARIHAVCWGLFQDSLLRGAPVADELLANIVRGDVGFAVPPVLRQCLAPYAVLAEYWLGRADTARSISRVFHLLRMRHMPRRFAPLLLAQLLPMFREHLTLPDLVVTIELIDGFEKGSDTVEVSPDDELDFADADSDSEADNEMRGIFTRYDMDELYQYAVENPPLADEDWRVVLKARGDTVPATVAELVHELREQIVAKIGRVYVGQV